MTKSSSYLIIIPCYNEAQNIASVISELRRDTPDFDILCINDASTDETEVVLRKTGVPYINLPFNQGYAGALQAGFYYAAYNDYDFVIQFDGDGQHIASEIHKLIALQKETQADIVIGSRFLLDTGYKHSFLKNIAIFIFKYCIRLVSGIHITDPTSGFQVITKRVYRFYVKPNQFPQFPDANLILEMSIRGCVIREVGVKMRLRQFGVSMHSGFLKPIKYMIHMFYSLLVISLNYASLKRQKL